MKYHFLVRCIILMFLFSGAVSARTSLSYQKFRRLNDPKRMVKSQDKLNLHVDRDYYFDASFIKADVSLELHSYDRDVNYSISEGYYFFSYYDMDFAIGRKILDWNPNEKFWGTNNLNSRRNFTLLDLKREGLVGLHHSSEVGNLQFDIFFSYLHIPTLNPKIEVANGRVVSESEWVVLPPTRTTVEIDGIVRYIPINYSIDEPSYGDTVFKKSLGLRTSYRWEVGDGRPGSASVYGLYKPENFLRINAEAVLDRSEQREVSVTASPIVNHHVLLGANVSQSVEGIDGTWTLSLGAEYIDPNTKIGRDFDAIDPMQMKESNRHFKSNFFVLKPNYDRESYFQGSLSHSNEAALFSLNYFKLLSRPLIVDDFYSRSNQWIDALGVNIKVNADERFDLGLDVKYDLGREDFLIVAEVGYLVNREFFMGIGLEVLDSPRSDSFWAPYRANDSLYFRIGHIF